MNIHLLITALIGLSSVLLGSFAEHSLQESLSEELVRKFMVAVRYQQNYSIILLVLSLLNYFNLEAKLIKKFNLAFWIFLFAVVTFSSSIYLFVLTDVKAVSYIAPIGGISIMLAWLYLAFIAIKKD